MLPLKLDETQVWRADVWFVCRSSKKRDTDMDKIFIYLFEDLVAAGYMSYRLWRLPTHPPSPRMCEFPHSPITTSWMCHLRKLALAFFSLCCAILTKNGNPAAGMYPQEQKSNSFPPCFILSSPPFVYFIGVAFQRVIDLWRWAWRKNSKAS